tara:strand:- start:2045 stop:2302 length:258 start_codon:yes stop_codon:yes gene_type:complete
MKNDKKITYGMDRYEQILGNEFGLFDFSEETAEVREEKWFIISHLIKENKIAPEHIGDLFEKNPFFFDWYKRVILSDVPIPSTLH